MIMYQVALLTHQLSDRNGNPLSNYIPTLYLEYRKISEYPREPMQPIHLAPTYTSTFFYWYFVCLFFAVVHLINCLSFLKLRWGVILRIWKTRSSKLPCSFYHWLLNAWSVSICFPVHRSPAQYRPKSRARQVPQSFLVIRSKIILKL